jgi:hypothetical protein
MMLANLVIRNLVTHNAFISAINNLSLLDVYCHKVDLGLIAC